MKRSLCPIGLALLLCLGTGSVWASPTMDFNDDGHVDLADFAILSSQWGLGDCRPGNQWCDGWDWDFDGLVYLTELITFTSHWQDEYPQ